MLVVEQRKEADKVKLNSVHRKIGIPPKSYVFSFRLFFGRAGGKKASKSIGKSFSVLAADIVCISAGGVIGLNRRKTVQSKKTRRLRSSENYRSTRQLI